MTTWQPGQYVDDERRAEEMAAHHMRALGHPGAHETPVGPDSGIDVVAEGAIAQVKFRQNYTGRAELQNLAGARETNHHLELWFFSATRYTTNALEYADRNGIRLFTYDLQGALTAHNGSAHRALAYTPAQPSPAQGEGRPGLEPTVTPARLLQPKRSRRKERGVPWLRYYALQLLAIALLAALILASGVGPEWEAMSPGGQRIFDFFGKTMGAVGFIALAQTAYRYTQRQ